MDFDLKFLPIHKELIYKEEVPSQFIIYDDYHLLFIRIAHIDDVSIQYKTRRFCIIDNQVYEFKFDTQVWQSLGRVEELYFEIENIAHLYEQILEGYTETIEDKEESLYLRQLSVGFLQEWFDLKRDLTRLDRILTRLVVVLKKLGRNVREIENLDVIVELVESEQRMASLLISRIDTIYNFVNSLKNDKMNRNLYVLTLISAIFLPLNFVIGFFGMNTQNMLLQNDPQGTIHVGMGMILMVIIMIAGLPIFKMIERYIFRRILGRFSFYQKIARKSDL